jgi:hypothetical protein
VNSKNDRLSGNHLFNLALALAVAGGCSQGPLELYEEGGTDLHASSPAANDLPAATAVAWADLMMKVVGDEKIGSPEAARLYALTSVALYESVVDGMPGFHSLGRQLTGLPKLKAAPPGLHLDWPTVMARATGALASDLLSTRPNAVVAVAALVDQQLAARMAAHCDAKVFAKSLEHGDRLGVDLVAWAHADGFTVNRDRPYTPPQGPDLWVPTGGAPADLRPVEPFFAQTRPLVMTTSSTCSPGAPPPYSEEPGSPLYLQAQAVQSARTNLTPEQDAIARYWADGGGTPATPGHWMSIARGLVASATLARAVQVFVAVGVTQQDAFISCWDSKYAYNHLRPETYLRRVIDPAWTPLFPTPQHPEHTSGHSCSAAAAAEVLTALFGERAFDDQTYVSRGLPARHYASFAAAAQEAAVSRLYSGHHFPAGSEGGLRSGQCVARQFLQKVALNGSLRGGRVCAAVAGGGN